MKKKVMSFMLAAMFLATSLPSLAAASNPDAPNAVKRAQSAAQVLDEIMSAPDSGIPSEILDSAECVAITPSMLKAGFIFGGHYGKGVASCRTPHGWSAPAPFTVSGGSWGLQAGGQSVDTVMLIMNREGMHNLLSSHFKLGGDASATAGPVGRHVAAGTDWKMRAQVLTYSRSRGVFAGISLNGAVIKQDKDATRVLYNRTVPFQEILNGKARVPQGTSQLVDTLQKYAPINPLRDNHELRNGS